MPDSEIVRYPFPKEPMARRRLFLDSLDIMLELYRNEGMSDLEIRDGLKAKVVELNEAQEDAA
ncbi:hypothetical protein [Bradyrhizobium neotropicale]|uniref:hypothetical protein n=1 Tax=Bradyrhizobium neotropicale TaxID=1497615 RepID=UPI001AD63F22|nr:hypothetical protein [Bradyrhizobium neotropicale]MBO4228054.1 hypothetical protein [Bradyrhizobium neotropicale]